MTSAGNAQLNVGGVVRGMVRGHRWSMNSADEDRAIGEVVDRLAKAFPGVSVDKVTQVVTETRPEFQDVPIRDFVPLFVERGAKQRLRELV